MNEKCQKCSQRIPWVCFFGNLTLAIFKTFVGHVSGSKGLVADGMHSGSDVIATIMVIISLKIASKKENASHPWGYGKIEFAGALIVYSILFALSILLFVDATKVILSGEVKPPHIASLIAASVSIIANFILSGYGFCAGRKLNSPALIANAQENRADMLSSVAVVLGIIGANMGFVILDALAAIFVSLFIFRTALTLGLEAYRKLLDISIPAPKMNLIKNVALQYKQVKGVNFIKTRSAGQSILVDMEILLDARMSVNEGYAVAREVRLALIRKFKHIKDASVFFTCKEKVGIKKLRLTPVKIH